MRYRLIIPCTLLFFMFPNSALLAQARQDALRALQTLQSRCESGFNYDGYATALDEAQEQLKEFFDSREAEKNPGFSASIERALIAYQSAFVIWKAKLEYKQDFVRSDHPAIQKMLTVYPEASDLFNEDGQANCRNLISFFWDKADARIAEAKRSTSGGKQKR
ncbi:MAG: hypothetical protein AB9866_20170 [Syntrophobacteraceae bacterium]